MGSWWNWRRAACSSPLEPSASRSLPDVFGRRKSASLSCCLGFHFMGQDLGGPLSIKNQAHHTPSSESVNPIYFLKKKIPIFHYLRFVQSSIIIGSTQSNFNPSLPPLPCTKGRVATLAVVPSARAAPSCRLPPPPPPPGPSAAAAFCEPLPVHAPRSAAALCWCSRPLPEKKVIKV